MKPPFAQFAETEQYQDEWPPKAVVPPNHPATGELGVRVDKLLQDSLKPEPAPAGESPRRVQPNRRGKAMQPMAGARQKIIGAQLETVEFANRRKKNRARRELAKHARRKNRGK